MSANRFESGAQRTLITHRANIKIIDVLKNLLGFLVNQIDSLLVFTITDQEGELSVRRYEIDFFCGLLFPRVFGCRVFCCLADGWSWGSRRFLGANCAYKDRQNSPEDKNDAPTEEFHVSRFTNPTDLWQTTILICLR